MKKITQNQDIFVSNWFDKLTNIIQNNGDLYSFIVNKDKDFDKVYLEERTKIDVKNQIALQKELNTKIKEQKDFATFDKRLSAFEQALYLLQNNSTLEQGAISKIIDFYAKNGGFSKNLIISFEQKANNIIDKMMHDKQYEKNNQELHKFMQACIKTKLSESLQNTSKTFDLLQKKFARLLNGESQEQINLIQPLIEQQKEVLTKEIKQIDYKYNMTKKSINFAKEIYIKDEDIKKSKELENKIIREFVSIFKKKTSNPSSYITNINNFEENTLVIFKLLICINNQDIFNNILKLCQINLSYEDSANPHFWYGKKLENNNSSSLNQELWSPIMSIRSAKQKLIPFIKILNFAGIKTSIITPISAQDLLQGNEQATKNFTSDELLSLILKLKFNRDGIKWEERSETDKSIIAQIYNVPIFQKPAGYNTNKNSKQDISNLYSSNLFLFLGSSFLKNPLVIQSITTGAPTLFASPNVDYALNCVTNIGEANGKPVNINFINVYKQGNKNIFYKNTNSDTPNEVSRLEATSNHLQGIFYTTAIALEQNPLVAQFMQIDCTYRTAPKEVVSYFIDLSNTIEPTIKKIAQAFFGDVKSSFSSQPDILQRLTAQTKEYKNLLSKPVKEAETIAKPISEPIAKEQNIAKKAPNISPIAPPKIQNLQRPPALSSKQKTPELKKSKIGKILKKIKKPFK